MPVGAPRPAFPVPVVRPLPFSAPGVRGVGQRRAALEDVMIETMTDDQAIRALKRLAKRWPETLWLFSGGGSLYVMRAGSDGKPVTTSSGGVDPDYIADHIDIPNDGGGW